MRYMQRLLQGIVLVTLTLSAGQATAGEYAVPVKIANTPVPVTVTNPVAGVKEPFQHQFGLYWSSGQVEASSVYYVPAGKRLVVEYASMFVFLPAPAETMYVRILTRVNMNDGFNTLAVQRQEDYGSLKVFGAAHLVRIHADPGSMVKVIVGRYPFTGGEANCAVTLSGFLEAVP